MLRRVLMPVLCLLAACTSDTSAPEVEVTRSLGFRHRGLVGMEPVPVRVFFQTESSNREITGVPCSLTGRGYSAEFASPAVVNIPDYGMATPVPTVTCRFGKSTVSAEPEIFNRTETAGTRAAASGAGGGPVVSLVARAMIHARPDAVSDDFAFHPVQVRFTE